MAGSPDVVARFAEIGRRVNELDGLRQPPKARVRIELVVRNHLGGVNAGEGTIQRVFQQARRADGERGLDLQAQGAKIAQQLDRQVGLLKGMANAVVRQLFERQVRKVIALDEFFETVGGDDRHGRNVDFNAGKRAPGSTACASRSLMKTRPLAFPPSDPVPIRVKRKVPSQKLRSKAGRSATARLGLDHGSLRYRRDSRLSARRQVGGAAVYTHPRSWQALATRPMAIA